jgi:hypothetical protein
MLFPLMAPRWSEAGTTSRVASREPQGRPPSYDLANQAHQEEEHDRSAANGVGRQILKLGRHQQATEVCADP